MAEKAKDYLNWYKNDFENFEKNLNGQSVSTLHKMRKEAFNMFVEKGFPTTKIEEWKYTNIDTIAKTKFNLDFKEKQLNYSDIDKYFIDKLECFKLVFVNGRFEKKLSDKYDSKADYEILNLADYIDNNLNSDQNLLAQLANYKDDSLVALNTAFMQNGIVIKIKNGKVIDKPFFLVFISSDNNQQNLNQPRILVDSGINSSASIIESFQSMGSDTGFSNIVSEFYLNENSRLEHIKIQNQSETAYHISHQHAKLERNSFLNTTNINLGGSITRNNIWTILDGEGSECILNGVYIGKEKQHIDNATVIEHAKPNCLSTEVYKGIMGDHSRGVFNGKIHVYPDAQKTNAIQNNSGLLLSENASLDTKPQLEIYADDVRCTHGATIGQLDEDALFYLRSRGIGMQNARKMLVNAFAGDVTDQIKNDVLRDKIQSEINNKLNLIK